MAYSAMYTFRIPHVSQAQILDPVSGIFNSSFHSIQTYTKHGIYSVDIINSLNRISHNL